MPYRRSYGRRPMRRRRRQGTANKALAVAQSVRRLVNVEYKSVPTVLTADPNSTGTVQNLTAVAQGNDQDERSGNKIRLKRIVVKGTVEIHASGETSRVHIVVARDNNGSTTIPSITDLYTSADALQKGVPKLGDPQSNSRFSILMDKMILVNDVARNQHYVNFSRTLDSHCFFSGTAATDEGKGALYVFMASNEATNDPIVAITARVWYIDN